MSGTARRSESRRAPAAAAPARPTAVADAAPLLGLTAGNQSLARLMAPAPAATTRPTLARDETQAPTSDQAGAADAEKEKKKEAAKQDKPTISPSFLGKVMQGQLIPGGEYFNKTTSGSIAKSGSFNKDLSVPIAPGIVVSAGASGGAYLNGAARLTATLSRDDSNPDKLTDTATLGGGANFVGGLNGSLRAGLGLGFPFANVTANVSGHVKLDCAVQKADFKGELKRETDSDFKWGSWSSTGEFNLDVKGTVKAGLSGSLDWKVLWFRGSLLTIKIGEWAVATATLNIKGKFSDKGESDVVLTPKFEWGAPPAPQLSGPLAPKKPKAVSRSVARLAAGDPGDDEPRRGGGPTLARAVPEQERHFHSQRERAEDQWERATDDDASNDPDGEPLEPAEIKPAGPQKSLAAQPAETPSAP